jgi:NADH-quinone oxidoreductase subunit I
MLRCIFCVLCVEACPTEAITHTQLFEMSTTNRADAIYTKTELLVDRDGRPNHMFDTDRFADFEELAEADGWMRATSPQGREAYEGRVDWSGSAGVGVRPPEAGQAAAPERAEEQPGTGDA